MLPGAYPPLSGPATLVTKLAQKKGESSSCFNSLKWS